MDTRRINWSVWAGFVIAIAAFLSYFFFFVEFPLTRDVPWINYTLFAIAGVLLIVGLRRAFTRDSGYRGKILGPVFGVLSVGLFGLFCFVVFGSRDLPLSPGAPRVGQKAPAFSLADTTGKPVALAELLSAPVGGARGDSGAPKGVLLIFYRGYW